MALTKKATARVMMVVLILRAQDQARRTLGAHRTTDAGRKKRSRVRKLALLLIFLAIPTLSTGCGCGDSTPGPDPGDADYSVHP